MGGTPGSNHGGQPSAPPSQPLPRAPPAQQQGNKETHTAEYASSICSAWKFGDCDRGEACRYNHDQAWVDATLFVGRIPVEASEEEVHSSFAPHGELASVSISKHKVTGKSRGFGFVTFCREEDMAGVLNSDILIRNKKVAMERAVVGGKSGGKSKAGHYNHDQAWVDATLFVGRIPVEASEEEVRSSFAPHGELASVSIAKNKFTGKSKGFGFVTFCREEDIADVLNSDIMIRNKKVAMERAVVGGKSGGKSKAGSQGWTCSCGWNNKTYFSHCGGEKKEYGCGQARSHAPKSVVRNSSSNTTSSNTTNSNTTSSSGVDNGGWETAKSKKKDKKEKKEPRKDPRTDTSNNGYGANPKDWECPNCNIKVFANRDECYRCHAQKPKTKPLPSSLKPRAQQAKPSSKKKQLHDPKIAQIRAVIGMQPTDGRVKELLRLTRGDVNQAVSLFYETGRLLSTPEESSGGGGGGGGGGGTDDDGWETVDHR